MAPDVLLRKLAYMRQLLTDLTPFKGANLARVEAEHYKLERLLKLLIMSASDILHHLLAEQGVTPGLILGYLPASGGTKPSTGRSICSLARGGRDAQYPRAHVSGNRLRDSTRQH